MADTTKDPILFPDTMRDFTYTRAEMGWTAFEALRSYVVFADILAVGALVYLLLPRTDGPTDILVLAGYVLVSLALITGAMLVVGGLMFFLIWRRTAHQRLLAISTLCGFDDQALYISSPLGAYRISWPFFKSFRETKWALIFHDGVRPYCLPKRMWSATELDHLRTLCQDLIPRRRTVFKR